MSMGGITESVAEQAALAWLESLAYAVLNVLASGRSHHD